MSFIFRSSIRRLFSTAVVQNEGLLSFIPITIRDRLKTELTEKQLKKVVKMVRNEIQIPSHMCKPLPPRERPVPPKGCVKELSMAMRKKGGRNHHGKITVRHIGGGFKRRIRLLDTSRSVENPQTVLRLEHDPNRSGKIALVRDTVTGEFSYILACQGMEKGSVIENNTVQQPGSTLKLSQIAVGTTIHNLEIRPGAGGQLVRSAGTHATLVGKDPDNKFCTVKLPSGKTKKVLLCCRATVGAVSNPDWHLRVIGKAGRNRNLGIRPTVRGVAMNPIDHPHGGGKGGRSKGHHSQSPWGKICKLVCMVVLGIIGLPGSGKSQVATELRNSYGFETILIRPAALSADFDAISLHELETQHSFPSLSEAADYAMTNWKTNFVMLGLENSEETIELFRKRPIFILMQIVAPVLHRWQRSLHPGSLEDFISRDGQFTSSPCFIKLQEICKIILSNDGSVEDLKLALGRLELDHKKWIRPDWDQYFMKLADLASQRSNCMKRRVGAVIVQDCKVVATGYNGTPRRLPNCSEGGCPRCNQNAKCGLNLDFCICMHAEENALLEVGAARAHGCTLYSTSTPCLGCTKKIIQVGIKRVIFDIEYSIDHNSKDLFDAAGVTLEKLQPPLSKYYSSKELAKM